jgi:Holliday junction DNA helicase RuvA
MRLLSELRERAGAMPAGTGFAPVLPPPGGDAAADALSALVNLGYRRPEAQAALARVTERLGQGAALDALIRDSLKELAR